MVQRIRHLLILFLLPLTALSWSLCACAAMTFEPQPMHASVPKCCAEKHSDSKHDSHDSSAPKDCPHCTGSAQVMAAASDDSTIAMHGNPAGLFPFAVLTDCTSYAQPNGRTLTHGDLTGRAPPPPDLLKLHCVLLI